MCQKPRTTLEKCFNGQKATNNKIFFTCNQHISHLQTLLFLLDTSLYIKSCKHMDI